MNSEYQDCFQACLFLLLYRVSPYIPLPFTCIQRCDLSIQRSAL